MIRRQFIKHSSVALAASLSPIPPLAGLSSAELKDLIIGHHSHLYKIDLNWGTLDSSSYPVNNCHEMVMDSLGRIILLTDHPKNNILIYNRSGKIREAWTAHLEGAHGLTIHKEGDEDFLYITDSEMGRVIKTTLSGQIILELEHPSHITGYYPPGTSYKPTETAIADNGDIYVADGYGEQWIIHYDKSGQLKNVFGGKEHFNNAHGIAIDDRDKANPTLLITARAQNKLKRFSLNGAFISMIDLPGAYICRPVIHGDNVYLATIWSGDGSENSGFISILDKEDKLISAPGGSTPIYENGKLKPMHQAFKLFSHPHDVCVDNEENLYIAQWNAGHSYPIKLIRL